MLCILTNKKAIFATLPTTFLIQILIDFFYYILYFI
jgi:hypothetical protein